MRTLITLAAILLGTSSYAATVATGRTTIGDTAGIELKGNDVSVAAKQFYGRPRGYRFTQDTIGDWVWTPEGEFAEATYEFTFDLSGYDLNTVSLDGHMAADNYGSAKLNGVEIFALDQFLITNFNTNHAFGTKTASLFNAGVNTLTFDVRDVSDYYGLAADVTVSAELSSNQVAPVPLPAGGVLMLTGLVGLTALRRKKG